MGVFDIFDFFSARGRGEGSPRRQEGGGIGFVLKITGGGGVSRTGAEGLGGSGGIGEFFLGGGLNILFRGRNVHSLSVLHTFFMIYGGGIFSCCLGCLDALSLLVRAL